MFGETKAAKADAAEVLAQVLEEMRYLRGTSTELMSHLRSQSTNGVLEVCTCAIGADGIVTRQYNTAVGSIVVANHAANEITVCSGGPTGSAAPTVGRGVQVVPVSSWLAIPIAAHSFTIYGTAADVIGLQVFTGMQAFGVTR